MVPDRHRRSSGRGRWVLIAIFVLVLGAAAATTTRISITEADQVDPDAFNSATYAADAYNDSVVPYIEENAIDLVELLDAIEAGTAEEDLGNAAGLASSFSFAVVVDGIAGEVDGNVMPITVDGVDSAIRVQIQTGPALNGTALRDVTGTISFNEFTNQLEYQQIGTELNNLVRSGVLASFDAEAAAGQQLRILGAFTRVNPELVSIVPISIEVVS